MLLRALYKAAWTPISTESAKSAKEVAAQAHARIVRAVCGGARLYRNLECPTVRAVVREEMRRQLNLTDKELLPDSGFALLRLLEEGIQLGERVLGPPPPRSLRGWDSLAAVSAEDGPMTGDVLISHPLAGHRVVLLLGADGPDGYAFGVITNMPTAAGISGDYFRKGPGRPVPESMGRRAPMEPIPPGRRVRDDDLSVFGDHAIFYGGPDGGANTTMLHPHGKVRGCVEVREGLYYGGDLAHAAELVLKEEALPRDFIFFKGRVDWRPGELRGELDFGEWAAARVGGPPFPPVGLMPRTASLALRRDGVQSGSAAVAPLLRQPSDPVGSTDDQTRRYQGAAWAHVVCGLSRAGGNGAPRLDEWLSLQLLPQGVEARTL